MIICIKYIIVGHSRGVLSKYTEYMQIISVVFLQLWGLHPVSV